MCLKMAALCHDMLGLEMENTGFIPPSGFQPHTRKTEAVKEETRRQKKREKSE